MLVLRRKVGESVVIGENIIVEVAAVEGERVKLAIDAPPDVVIVREELLQERDLHASQIQRQGHRI